MSAVRRLASMSPAEFAASRAKRSGDERARARWDAMTAPERPRTPTNPPRALTAVRSLDDMTPAEVVASAARVLSVATGITPELIERTERWSAMERRAGMRVVPERTSEDDLDLAVAIANGVA